MSELSFNTKLVEALNDKELNDVALFYLNKIELINGISIVDGTNDSGVDLLSRDIDKIEQQYQATTTKENAFRKKLITDLEKAQKNIVDKNFPNKVLYFYSRKITTGKKTEFRKLALKDYKLKLNFISAEDLASEAIINDELKKKLLSINNISKSDFQNNQFDTAKGRAYYDLMTIGTSTDIKFNIIRAYVINLLFNQGQTSKEGILKLINSNFTSTITEHYFDVFIKKLQSKNCIKVNQNYIELKKTEQERIKNLQITLNEHETHLRKSLEIILNDFGINTSLDKIISEIISLSKSRFSDTYSELIEKKSDFKSFEKNVLDFKIFIETIIEKKYIVENLIKEIIEFIDNNEFISIIASGSAYTNVNSLDNLENYIKQNHNNKSIFIDANVLIYLVLNFYDTDFVYENHRYKLINQFYKFSYTKALDLKTIYQYVIETANLFKYAYKLIPLTKGNYDYLISETNNVIYNFYINLKDNELLHDNEDFEKFLDRFGVNKSSYAHNNGIEKQITKILNSLEISTESKFNYDLTDTNELMMKHFVNKNKSLKALQNDSLMFERLADSNVDVNPIEPIFCTWDFSLMAFREKYFSVNPNCTQWFMFTPSRLIEHFSMMSLTVGQGTLTNEVLLILEEDISFNNKTRSLIDNIITLIDTEDKIGLKYFEKINGIKQNEIYQIEDFSEKNEIKGGEIKTPADLLLSRFFEKFSDNRTVLENFFRNENYIDDFTKLISNNLEYYLNNKKINTNFNSEIDIMIENFEKNED
jgi:hypothetical protein